MTAQIIADASYLIVRDLIAPAAIIAAIVLRVGRRRTQPSSDERPAA